MVPSFRLISLYTVVQQCAVILQSRKCVIQASQQLKAHKKTATQCGP